MKKIMVFGTFDRLHLGHEFVLKQAMKRGEVTVVIARDENVKRIKGKQAMETEAKRLQVIAKRFPTVTLLLGDPQNFLSPVRTTKPDLVLLGYDQKLPPGVKEGDLGCKIERLESFHPERYKSSLLS